MATLIKGLLSQNLPWGLVLVGVFIAVTLELCGVHSLSFAVGAYLPIATTAPIFVGGLVRWWVERGTGVTSDSDLSSGTLFSSGLIAGGSLAGILYAVLYGADMLGPFQSIGNALPFLHRRRHERPDRRARCCSRRWRSSCRASRGGRSSRAVLSVVPTSRRRRRRATVSSVVVFRVDVRVLVHRAASEQGHEPSGQSPHEAIVMLGSE